MMTFVRAQAVFPGQNQSFRQFVLAKGRLGGQINGEVDIEAFICPLGTEKGLPLHGRHLRGRPVRKHPFHVKAQIRTSAPDF